MTRVRVVEVVRETADAHTLVLEPAGARFSYRPGQFLTVRIPNDGAGGAARCYSLSSSPDVDDKPAITVKRTVGGYVSNWICDHVVAGTEIEVLPPAGTFVPGSLDDDVLLLAGGSGITPTLSILTSVLAAGSGRVHLLYANRDAESVIFAGRLATLAREHAGRLTVIHWLESLQGLPERESLRALVAPYLDREAYVCGPAPFMAMAEDVLRDLGVADRRVHVERFVSLEGDPFAPVEEIAADDESVALDVTLDGTTTELAWPASGRLLDVLLAAGLPAPYSCREGNCSACACVLIEGEVDLERNQVLDAADLADRVVLACQARARTPRVHVSFDA